MAACGSDRDANQEKGECFCRQPREMGADVALFPEMWNTGYTFFDPTQPGAREAWLARVLSSEDGYVAHFRNLARELQMAIGLTLLERWPGSPRYSVTLIDRRGEVRMTYAKVHTCDFDREAALTPGDGFHTCTLDTSGELCASAP